jgi:hypothetical protein
VQAYLSPKNYTQRDWRESKQNFQQKIIAVFLRDGTPNQEVGFSAACELGEALSPSFFGSFHAAHLQVG